MRWNVKRNERLRKYGKMPMKQYDLFRRMDKSCCLFICYAINASGGHESEIGDSAKSNADNLQTAENLLATCIYFSYNITESHYT